MPNIFILRTYNDIKIIIVSVSSNIGIYRQNFGVLFPEKKKRYIMQNIIDIIQQIELLITGIKKDILYQ